MSVPDLTLHEEVLLLALHDDKGTTTASMYGHALGGAILAELLLRERIVLEKGGRKGDKLLVTPGDPSPTGDPTLDRAAEAVRGAKRRATPETWVQRFGQLKGLKHEVAQQLRGRGIVRLEEDEILLFFHRKRYPTVDPGPEREIVERIRSAVLGDDAVEDRTAILVGVAHSAGLLRGLVERRQLKARRQRIEELTRGGVAGEATEAAIQAVRAMIAVTTITAATTATT